MVTPDAAQEIRAHLQRLEATSSPGFTARVTNMFLTDTAVRITALREAIARRDQRTVRELAHTIYGGASLIGALSMAAMCVRIIDSARESAFDQCEVSFSELETGFESIRQALAGVRVQ